MCSLSHYRFVLCFILQKSTSMWLVCKTRIDGMLILMTRVSLILTALLHPSHLYYIFTTTRKRRSAATSCFSLIQLLEN